MAEKTCCIQIGNSDNKLTQQEWSQFVEATIDIVQHHGVIHFSGGSPTEKKCWRDIVYLT